MSEEALRRALKECADAMEVARHMNPFEWPNAWAAVIEQADRALSEGQAPTGDFAAVRQESRDAQNMVRLNHEEHQGSRVNVEPDGLASPECRAQSSSGDERTGTNRESAAQVRGSATLSEGQAPEPVAHKYAADVHCPLVGCAVCDAQEPVAQEPRRYMIEPMPDPAYGWRVFLADAAGNFINHECICDTRMPAALIAKALNGMAPSADTADTPTPAGMDTARAKAIEECARIAQEYSAFTGAGYCDVKGPPTTLLMHDYGRGGCDVRRGIAAAIRALATKGAGS